MTLVSQVGAHEGAELAQSGLCTCLRGGSAEDFVFHLNQLGLFSEL